VNTYRPFLEEKEEESLWKEELFHQREFDKNMGPVLARIEDRFYMFLIRKNNKLLFFHIQLNTKLLLALYTDSFRDWFKRISSFFVF
jgi:hypothetical protein